jgi:hypothetical protein
MAFSQWVRKSRFKARAFAHWLEGCASGTSFKISIKFKIHGNFSPG